MIGTVLRMVTPVLMAMAAMMTTMVMSSAMTVFTFPVSVVPIVVTFTIPISAMSILVIESAYGIDYRIGECCADQHFRNPVAIVISARTERKHQADRNARGNKPAGDRTRHQNPFCGVHDVVS